MQTKELELDSICILAAENNLGYLIANGNVYVELAGRLVQIRSINQLKKVLNG